MSFLWEWKPRVKFTEHISNKMNKKNEKSPRIEITLQSTHKCLEILLSAIITFKFFWLMEHIFFSEVNPQFSGHVLMISKADMACQEQEVLTK